MEQSPARADVLACQQLCKHYEEGPRQLEVLKDINLRVGHGEKVSIIGASGSGKSTLLNLLGGLDDPSSGEVFIAGNNLTSMNARERGQWRNRALGFVYQFHHLLMEFTALENIAMPLLIGGIDVADARRRGLDALAAVGLAERAEHKPSALSGGERQRVAIARALVSRPHCVLMDEPTGNLDGATGQVIQQLMDDLNQELGISFLIVTHDQHFARSMDRVYRLADAGIVEIEPASV